ncbi:hypothetical protein EDD17DRAFT_1847153 [Pisolithus thermaeus]|nr:hypothetical protein EV401DRAFT_1888075 [Pisolithus croceorrhizus]KAI6156325.1 hypothetical protein EDD17DRAFT_1847153 [Pisolithus thermaeus]
MRMSMLIASITLLLLLLLGMILRSSHSGIIPSSLERFMLPTLLYLSDIVPGATCRSPSITCHTCMIQPTGACKCADTTCHTSTHISRMAKPFGARLFSAWSDIVFLIFFSVYPLHKPPGIRMEALRLLAGQSTVRFGYPVFSILHPCTLDKTAQGSHAAQFHQSCKASYNDPHHPKQATALLIAHYLIFNLRASCIQASVEWQKGSKAGGHTTHQPNFVEGAVTPLAGLVKRKVRNMSGIGSKDLSDPIGDPAEEKN